MITKKQLQNSAMYKWNIKLTTNEDSIFSWLKGSVKISELRNYRQKHTKVTSSVSLGSMRPAGRYHVPLHDFFASWTISISSRSFTSTVQTMYVTVWRTRGTKLSVSLSATQNVLDMSLSTLMELMFSVPFNTNTGHFWDVLPSWLLIMVLKKLNLTQQKQKST